MLKLRGIHTYYGKSHILHGVNLEVNQKELVTLLGRNGVGKTTTLKSIMGLLEVRCGSIEYKNDNILTKPTHDIFRKGLGYVPQGRRIFSTLSVHENLKLSSPNKKEEEMGLVLDIFPVLKKKLNHRGNELSGGEQQMLAIARVLAGRPEFILLDEPSEGIAPLLVKSIMGTVQQLNQAGLTILLVESNLPMAADLGKRHYIMANGVVVAEVDSKQLLEDTELQREYFKL